MAKTIEVKMVHDKDTKGTNVFKAATDEDAKKITQLYIQKGHTGDAKKITVTITVEE